MSTPVRRAHPARRIAAVGLTVTAVLIISLSGSFGRAQPLGSYRPELPPSALTNGCWPLPAGVALDFPYQVRRDGDVGRPGREHRRLEMQFDLIDADTARKRVREPFVAVGFTEAASLNSQVMAFHQAHVGRVRASVAPLAGVPDNSIVRGRIVLTLPVTQAQTDSPVCSQPFSTKRFTPETDGPA